MACMPHRYLSCFGPYKALRTVAAICVAALAVSSTTAALSQTALPAPPPDPAFPKLFPKYTGLNGYEDLVVAGDLISRSEVARAAEESDATLKQMRAALEDPEVERALGMLHSGLDKQIQSPRDPDKLDEKTLLPEYAGFRALARVLAIEEYVVLADGRVSKAIEIMRDGLRLGYVIQSETLISGLVGISIDAISLERLAHHYDQMSLKDCIQVIAVAQEWLKLPSPTETVLMVENKCLHNMLGACRNDPERLRELMKSLEPKGPPTSDSDLAAIEVADYVNANGPGVQAMLDQALALADEETRKQISEVRQQPWQRKPAQKFETRASMAHRFCGLLLPSYEIALNRFDTDRVKMHLLGTHAAIHRFRWENNRLPSSLADLKLPVMTTDPFTGKPLQYQVKSGSTNSESSYTLYSAGPANSGGSVTPGQVYLPRQ
jgi:hypothetical protein